MNTTKKVLAALGELPLAAFGVDVGGALSIETGYRFDQVEQKFIEGSDEIRLEYKDINGVSLGLNGLLTLNEMYIRAMGDYVFITQEPKFVASQDVESETGFGSKEFAADALVAFGYTFAFNQGEYTIAPEAGFAYSRDTLSKSGSNELYLESGTGFVGANFNWLISPDWNFGLLFDFHFAGYRNFTNTADSPETLSSMIYGPEAKASFDYFFTENWSLGVAYRFKYLFTSKKTQDELGVDESVTWMTNNATFNIGYTF